MKGKEIIKVIYRYNTVINDYIKTMKTTFLFKFLLLTIFFRITSLQIFKEKLFQLTGSLDFYI